MKARHPGAGRHETGPSVRWGDMKAGFHVVLAGLLIRRS
jgi:hypothetical protein